MQKFFSFHRAWCLVAAMAVPAGSALAHEGHDDAAPAATAGAEASPRFAARSDAFELVGILQGPHLALYLDHAGDNRPAQDATLALDIGGKPVPVHAEGEGLFEAELAEPPEGELAIVATVSAGGSTDRLAATLDVHGHAETAAAQKSGRWRPSRAWAAGVALAVAMAVALAVAVARGRRQRRSHARRMAVTGGAA